jgi:hypothetical protein
MHVALIAKGGSSAARTSDVSTIGGRFASDTFEAPEAYTRRTFGWAFRTGRATPRRRLLPATVALDTTH